MNNELNNKEKKDNNKNDKENSAGKENKVKQENNENDNGINMYHKRMVQLAESFATRRAYGRFKGEYSLPIAIIDRTLYAYYRIKKIVKKVIYRSYF